MSIPTTPLLVIDDSKRFLPGGCAGPLQDGDLDPSPYSTRLMHEGGLRDPGHRNWHPAIIGVIFASEHPRSGGGPIGHRWILPYGPAASLWPDPLYSSAVQGAAFHRRSAKFDSADLDIPQGDSPVQSKQLLAFFENDPDHPTGLKRVT